MMIDIIMASVQKAVMHANCLTPNPLGVIFIIPGNIFYVTQWASLIRPRTGIEQSVITLN